MADRPGLRQIEKGYVEVSYTVTCRCPKCTGLPEWERYQDLELKKDELYDRLVAGEWGVRTESDGFQPWRVVKGKLIHPDCFLRMSDESPCPECAGWGRLYGFEGSKKIKFTCETCGGE